jgi:hypothetical protein
MNINEIIKKVLKEEFLTNSLIYEDIFGSVEEVHFLMKLSIKEEKSNLEK